MAREKKPVHKVPMTEGKHNIIQMFLQEHDIESAQDIQDALKDLLNGTIKEASCIPPNRISALYRASGQKYHEVCGRQRPQAFLR